MSQGGILNSQLSPSGDVQTLTGNTGVASAVAGNINVVTTNSTVRFVGSGNTLTQDFNPTNMAFGSTMPSVTLGTLNTAVGNSSLNAVTTGSSNSVIGYHSGLSLTQGSSNVLIGSIAGHSLTTGNANVVLGSGSLITADDASNQIAIGSDVLVLLQGTVSEVGNIAIGNGSLDVLTTGAYNVAIGQDAGNTYTGDESSNILLGSPGVVGESHTIRIGRNGSGDGQQNRAFMAGITGVTVAASAPIAIDTNGQISSLGFGTTGQILTSTGAASSPTWQAPVTGTTQSSAVASGSAVALTTATNANITSISLTAGTWLVSGIVQYSGNPTVSGPQQASISATSATHGTLGDSSVQAVWLSTNFTVGALPITIPGVLLTLGSTTTIYLVASGVFSAGAMSAYGRISGVKIA